MCSTVYFVGAGLTRSLQLERRVPLMLDFVSVMTDYVDNDVVLNSLVAMEIGQVYKAACNDCLSLAEQISGNQGPAAKDQRARFAELVASRPQESIERLFERVLAAPSSNLYGSELKTYFRYAINQVFSEIGWDLQLDLLERFLRPRFQDEGGKHTFVSFNYDLALDRAVERTADGLWQPCEGYGFEFPLYTTTEPASDSPADSARAFQCQGLPKGSSRIRILKPHGSLNWFRRVPRPGQAGDNAAGNLVLPLDANGQLRYWRSTNTFCYIAHANQPHDYEILIAPPSPNKPPIMQQAIDDEALAIREADEIFVIGYSIPDTDQDQRSLIRKAVQGRSKAIESLTIVNYQAGQEYFEETNALFAPRSMRAFNSGFADFVGQA